MNIETDRSFEQVREAASAARAAARALAQMPDAQRSAGIRAAATAIRAAATAILAANEADLAAYRGSSAFRDRLALTPARVEAMAAGLDEIAALPDPLDRTLAEWTRPNGLRFRRVAAPIGVIGMIYESRPNVGADAAGLCLKSGNAVILRGGSDSFHSAARDPCGHAPRGCARPGCRRPRCRSPPGTDRGYVAAMLGAAGLIDLIIPRGGRSLVERVQREARVPVLAHAEGLCHTYVHAAADPAMARAVLANAKMRRTGVCGATETLLIDAAIAPTLLPRAGRRSARARLRLPRRCAGPRDRARICRPRRAAISTPNGSTRCSRSRWWTAWTRRSPTSPATAASIPRRSSPRTRPRPSASSRGVGQRGRAVERLDPVLRRRRVRLRRRDRHRHRAHPCARAGRARAAHHASATS